MARKSGYSSQITVILTPIRAKQLANLLCPKCRSELDLHQPVIDRPMQLLATCSGCDGWFRVETRAGEAQGIIVSLPELTPYLALQDTTPKHPA